MKKFLFIFVCICFLLNTIGCQRTNVNEIEGSESNVEYIKSVSSKPDYTNFSIIGEYTGNIVSDTAKDTVTLYIDAEYDEDGNLMKNDMNRWVLSVCDGATDEHYTLFDENVQLGDINFQLVDFFEEGKPYTKIILYKNSSAELMMKTFSYEKNMGFIAENIFNSSDYSDSGINLRFSTIPQI